MMDSVCTRRDHGRNSAPAFVKADSTRNKDQPEARVPPLVKSDDAERKDAPEVSGAELVNKEDQKNKDGCRAGECRESRPLAQAGGGSSAFVKTDSTRNKDPRDARVPPLVKSEAAERKDTPEASGAELVKRTCGKDKRRAPSRDAKEGRAVLRCPWCGRPFERRASRQRFCDRHCRREWDNMRGRADRELARMEREVEAEEQRFRDLERERIHAGLLPWPEGLASRDGLSPWERDEADALGGVWANALLDPLPI